MTMNEIKVESANTMPLSTAQEWFIPMMDYTGNGDYWGAGTVARTKEEAEMQIRSCDAVKQGRIVRVLLPCKVVP
jgi:hypothetical protein